MGAQWLEDTIMDLGPIWSKTDGHWLQLWRSRATASRLVVEVLESEGSPLHWRELTERANERRQKLGMKALANQTVHNTVIKYDTLFSYAGAGTYGLKDWGEDLPYIRVLIRQALGSAGKPVSQNEAFLEVSKFREVVRNSVTMYLEIHDEFYLSRSGKYGLREWIVENPTLETSRDYVEDPRSRKRLEHKSA